MLESDRGICQSRVILAVACRQVVSGDVLVIRDSSSSAERRVTLSSIRAPRPARRDEKPEPYGTEAKEFLRQRLIGAPAQCGAWTVNSAA